MTWSYSNALTAAKDKVRLYLQDTDTTEQLLADEEITFLLAEKANNVLQTAALGAEIIARKFTREATITVGDTRVEWSRRAELYWELAKDLRTRTVAVAPFAGGISIDSKQTYEDDTDRVRPLFTKDQFVATGAKADENLEAS